MINLNRYIDSLDNKKFAVLGLGVSNRAAVKALLKAGAQVCAWDDNKDNHAGLDCEISDLRERDLNEFQALVLAPGIPHTLPAPHPVVTKAREAGVEILCDLELLHRIDHGLKTIGITGTNGKSTTTALIGHILKESGLDVSIGGNIGKAALDMRLPKKDGVIVLEISSFQLELCPTFSPDISVWLNLSPDHMDRHGTMENYADAKRRIFRGSGTAVIGNDDDYSRKTYKMIEEIGAREVIPISAAGHHNRDGVYVDQSTLFDAIYGEPTEVAELNIASLPGVHNHQNAAAAYAVARSLGIGPQAIIQAMRSFPGLQHRQFLTRTINGVAYVNDSKATNAAAAGRALTSYRNIYWIAGGKPKEGGLNGLEPYLDHVRHVFLIGEAMDEFGSWLDNHGVSHNFAGTLDTAVQDAHRMAQSERGQPGGTGTVLLSPACASFDQFKSFEERGNVFTNIVEKLPEEVA